MYQVNLESLSLKIIVLYIFRLILDVLMKNTLMTVIFIMLKMNGKELQIIIN